MTPIQSERDFQGFVIDLAHVYHWKVAHFRPALTKRGWRTPVSADGKGFPDLCLVRDRIIFIECKSQKGKLSLDQEFWRIGLTAAGVEYHLWTPETPEKEILKALE